MRSEIQVGEGELYDGNKEDENLENPCSSTGAFNDTLKKVELKPRKDQKHDMSNFLCGKTKSIYSHLTKNLEEKRGLKWFIGVKVRFVKHKPDGEDIFSAPHFRSLCVTTIHLHELEEQVQQAKQKVVQSFVMYQKEGSSWVLDEVLHMDLSMAHYKPMKGSSYIPLPKILQHKKAVINIKNSDDNCFMWSILASLHPVGLRKKPERIHHYQPYKDELNFNGIEFPVTIDKIEKYERQNNISVNVFDFEDVLFPVHITKQRFETHVNLLLYSQASL